MSDYGGDDDGGYDGATYEYVASLLHCNLSMSHMGELSYHLMGLG